MYLFSGLQITVSCFATDEDHGIIITISNMNRMSYVKWLNKYDINKYNDISTMI